MILTMLTGVFLGIAFTCILAVIICDKPDDKVKKPLLDAELTNKQAIQKLEEIKPYYNYKGRTWTALDMGVKALQEKEGEKYHERTNDNL